MFPDDDAATKETNCQYESPPSSLSRIDVTSLTPPTRSQPTEEEPTLKRTNFRCKVEVDDDENLPRQSSQPSRREASLNDEASSTVEKSPPPPVKPSRPIRSCRQLTLNTGGLSSDSDLDSYAPVKRERRAPAPPQTTKTTTTTTTPTSTLKKCPLPGCGKMICRLKRHLRTHTRDKPFKCTWTNCDKEYARNDNLTKHFRTHSDTARFSCPWNGCAKSYSYKHSLKEHYRSHLGFKYECLMCNRTYQSKDGHMQHIRLKHRP